MINVAKVLIPLLLIGGCAGVIGGDPDLYGQLDDNDVELAASLLQRTLQMTPDGETRKWVNQVSGHVGAITPTRTYLSASGHFCRDYREELAVGGESGRFYHTACRADSGLWIWL